MAINIPEYEQEMNPLLDDFHAVFTIQLGELIRDGLVDFTDGSWDAQTNGLKIKWFNEEQKNRFWAKFGQYYYYREIGEIPYKRWKDNLLSKVALIAPKYNLIYTILENGTDPMQEYDEYGKSRNIYSDFPQTMLSANEDYASTGNDNQFERIKQGSFIEKVLSIANDYNDADMLFIKELDSHFYSMLTSNMNGF